MTVASFETNPAPLLSTTGCSSEPLFPPPTGELQQQCFALTTPSSAMSFDWSDFPVLSQYNEDIPHVPPPAPIARLPFLSSFLSSSQRCSPPLPTANMFWEVNDDDATSFSTSSDEDSTILESRSEDIMTSNKRDPNKKSVTFSPVLEIRSHNVILGDHPCCACLALELSWEHQDVEVVDFDLHENSRRCLRCHLRALRLSYWDRRRLLEQSTGLSEEELLLQEQRAWREQLDLEVNSRDKAPALPQKTCSHEAATATVLSLLKKRSSGNLSSLAA